jgi:hypothetical protein
MGPALLLIAQLYRVERLARGLSPEARLELRQRHAVPVLEKLHGYLLQIEAQILPKSPAGRAVRYTLNNWTALCRYTRDGHLEIDNNATNAASGIGGIMPPPGLCRADWSRNVLDCTWMMAGTA